MIKYLLFKFIQWLVSVLPKKWSYWIGYRVADLDYLLKKDLRRAVKSNLKHIFLNSNHKTSINNSELSKMARDVFRNFAKYLVDFFSFSKLNSENIHEIVTIKGLENMKDALKKGKGAIGITAHIGNWELCAVVTALLGLSVNAVALSHENTKLNRLFVNQRASKGVRVIPVGSVAKTYLNVLKQNQIIALVGDRLNSDSGIEVNLFNKTVLAPKGPALLSIRVGAPIVPGFMVRTPEDKFSLVFEKAIDPDDFKESNEDAVKEITQHVTNIMEKYIAKYPSQWFLFTKIWE